MNIKAKYLLAGTFAVASAALFAAAPDNAPDKSVISINICQGSTHVGHIDKSGSDVYTTFAGDVPAGAWCCLDSVKSPDLGPITVAVAYDAINKMIVDGQSVTISGTIPKISNYSYDTNGDQSRVYTPDYMRMWLSQKNSGSTSVSLTVNGIPYSSYSVYVYFSGIPKTNNESNQNQNKGDTTFPAVTYLDSSYVPDQNGVAMVSSDTSWGNCSSCESGPLLGTNTIKFQNLSGGSFSIAYKAQDAGVAAIQIVDEGQYDYEGGEAEDGERPSRSVYSFNVCDGTSFPGHIGDSHAPLYTLCGWLPAEAWVDADATPNAMGTKTLANYWDAGDGEVKSDGVVTVRAGGGVNNCGFDVNGDATRIYGPDYMRMFLAKRTGSFDQASLTFGGIPFSRYSAIVYFSGEQRAARTSVNDGKAFYPVFVNGNVYYSWDDTQASVTSVSNDWGDCTQALSGAEDQTQGAVYGKNAIRIDGLVGSSLSLSVPCYAAGIAAVQIVDDSEEFVDGRIAVPVTAGMSKPVSGDAAEVTAPYEAAGLVKSGEGTLVVTTALTYPITLSGGTIRLLSGTGAGGSIAAAEGTRIEIVEDQSKDGVETVTYTGAPTVSVIGADGLVRSGVSVSTDGDTRTYSFTPSISGAACLCDFAFTNSLANAGKAGGAMAVAETQYGNDIYLNGSAVYTGAHPDVGTLEFWYPDSWTAVVKGKLPACENAVLASFGGMQSVCLALVTRPGLGGVSLVRCSGGAVSEICGFDVPSAMAAEHLFVVTVENQQNGRKVTLSVDGRAPTTATATVQNFGNMGNSARIGSAKNYGAVEGLVEFSGYGQVQSGEERRSYVKTLRVYDFALGPNATSAVISELGAFTPGLVIYMR